LPRVTGQLPASGEVAQIFTHQQVKKTKSYCTVLAAWQNAICFGS
jgi:hypothetical protein